jgi:hypothetical protein
MEGMPSTCHRCGSVLSEATYLAGHCAVCLVQVSLSATEATASGDSEEAQPEMAQMVQETGTAAPIIRRISQELSEIYPAWD